jgi:hypothetical protein
VKSKHEPIGQDSLLGVKLWKTGKNSLPVQKDATGAAKFSLLVIKAPDGANQDDSHDRRQQLQRAPEES